jgi:hypothetical protein
VYDAGRLGTIGRDDEAAVFIRDDKGGAAQIGAIDARAGILHAAITNGDGCP